MFLYWNRTPRPELAALPCQAIGSLLGLFHSADVVSLTFAHEPGVNDGVVTAEHLDALGPSGYLVIAGAAVDGYYTEPTPAPADAPHGLLALAPTRLLVTPHSAFHSTQAMARMAEMAVENLLAVHRGEGPPYAVSG